MSLLGLEGTVTVLLDDSRGRVGRIAPAFAHHIAGAPCLRGAWARRRIESNQTTTAVKTGYPESFGISSIDWWDANYCGRYFKLFIKKSVRPISSDEE